ncbi:hypothetical protein M0805_007651 [Coniferiporia weirii]|nr:hypothetical protein M0805_007651 [Coniferiporia weirii]
MDPSVHGRQPTQDINSQDKLDGNDDGSLAIGVTLSCDDMSDQGDECRLYRFYSAQHRSIDLVRATVVRHCPDVHSTASGSAARATFSSPVMSRQHARISFESDGSVSFMDLASMHGSYLQTTVAGSTRISDKLVPHKPYTLRSGDIVHLGKSIYRSDRFWQPVVVRVTLLQAETEASGKLPSSVNPALDASNRYGIYSEDDEEDDEISSSSFGEGDEEDLSSYSSSSSTSPLSSPINLGLPASIIHDCIKDNSAMDNKASTNESGSVDTGLSAGARLRSMLPLPFQSFHNLQNLQLPPLPPFPPLRPHLSLRDLGIFGNTDNINGTEGSRSRNRGATSSSDAIEDGDVTLNVDSRSSETDFKAKVREEEIDCSSGGGFGNEGDLYSYAFPSYPENQLGLTDTGLMPIFVSETNPGYVSTENAGEVGSHEIRIENEDGDGDDMYADEPESENEDEDRNSQEFEAESGDQAEINGGEEFEAPMEISPSPSLDSSPSFRAQVLSSEAKANMNASADADVDELDLHTNARAQQTAQALRESDGKPKLVEERFPDSALATVDAVKPKRTSLPQLLGHDSLEPSIWNWNSDWDASWDSGPEDSSRPLLSQIHALEARMVELRDSAAILKSASFPAVPSAPLPSVVPKEVEKELAGIREELRRLSSLMESAVTKLNEANVILHSSAQEPRPLATRVEQAVQVNDRAPSETPTGSANSTESSGSRQIDAVQTKCSQTIPSSSSLKRRRNDDEEREEATSAVANCAELSSERRRYCERPAKRARTSIEVGKVMRNVASAAGYTSLGMVIAWAALAYAP